jgi:hypothetical protein
LLRRVVGWKFSVGSEARLAVMMEEASTSETSVNFYQITRRNNPEDSHLHEVSSSMFAFCLSSHELKVLSNDAMWQNVLFYKCCNHSTVFKSTSNMGDENV